MELQSTPRTWLPLKVFVDTVPTSASTIDRSKAHPTGSGKTLSGPSPRWMSGVSSDGKRTAFFTRVRERHHEAVGATPCLLVTGTKRWTSWRNLIDALP